MPRGKSTRGVALDGGRVGRPELITQILWSNFTLHMSIADATVGDLRGAEPLCMKSVARIHASSSCADINCTRTLCLRASPCDVIRWRAIHGWRAHGGNIRIHLVVYLDEAGSMVAGGMEAGTWDGRERIWKRHGCLS